MKTLLEYVDDLINQTTQTKTFWDKHKGKILAASALGTGALAYKTGMFNFKHADENLFKINTSPEIDKYLPFGGSTDYSDTIKKGKELGGIAVSGVSKAVSGVSKATGHVISKKYHELFDPNNLERQRELSALRQTRNLYRSLKNQASLDKLSEKIKDYDS